jgi:hypothetical protein
MNVNIGLKTLVHHQSASCGAEVRTAGRWMPVELVLVGGCNTRTDRCVFLPFSASNDARTVCDILVLEEDD